MTEHTTPREPVAAGRVEDVPDRGCLAVADDRVLLARVDGRLVAWENRCLHRDTPLHEGAVRDGVLTCPEHFWRYELATGRNIASGAPLPAVPVEVTDDGQVRVWPPRPRAVGIRDLLLDHARTWDRDAPTTATEQP